MGTGTLDRFFSVAESVLDAMEKNPSTDPCSGRSALRSSRSGSRPNQSSQSPAPSRDQATDDSSARTHTIPGRPSTEVRPAVRRPPYRVIEALDPDDGSTIWVVTNGQDRLICSSADLAERAKVALG